MSIARYKTRFWAVYDRSGALVCVCLYRKGAREVVRRFETLQTAEKRETRENAEGRAE